MVGALGIVKRYFIQILLLLYMLSYIHFYVMIPYQTPF